MFNPEIVKKYIVVLVMISAAALGIALVVAPFVSHKPHPSQNVSGSLVHKTEIDHSKLPEGFPQDLPLESGAKVTQNYIATDPTQSQASRVFNTDKSLAENLTIYSNYFKSNDWDIISTVDQPKYKKLTAQKGPDQLQIALNEDATGQVRTVAITWSEPLH